MKGTFFITGIDTNIGKSYATGWLAREWNSKGIKTITQKMIQTGNHIPHCLFLSRFSAFGRRDRRPHDSHRKNNRVHPDTPKQVRRGSARRSRRLDGSYYSPIPDGRLHRRPTVAGYLGNVRAFRQHQPHAALYRSAGK